MMAHAEPVKRSLSPNRPSNVTQKNQDHEKAIGRAQNLQALEHNLLQLNLERDKYKDELGKIPEHAKTGA